MSVRSSLAVGALLVVALAALAAVVGQDPGSQSGKLHFDGRDRTYLLHLPPGRPATNLPLVVVLHGCGLQYLPQFLIGKTSRNLNTNETMWEFFRRASR
jgi:poly(3-hydroxybutyrate) depolymerase